MTATEWRDKLTAWMQRDADKPTKPRRMAACQNAKPDNPSCKTCGHRTEHNEDGACAWDMNKMCGGPCKPVSVAPQYERVELRSGNNGVLGWQSGLWWMSHALAMSEAGFSGYEYEDGHWSTMPVQQELNGEIRFPVAWRRARV